MPLFVIGTAPLDGGQIDLGDIGALMAQQARDLIADILPYKLLIGLGSTAVPHAAVHHGTIRTFALDSQAQDVDERLELVDGGACGHIIRDKKFLASLCERQHLGQLNADGASYKTAAEARKAGALPYSNTPSPEEGSNFLYTPGT